MRAPIFRGKVVQGRIVLDNRDRFKDYLRGFEGKKVEMILRERTAERSERQNAYYHAVVVEALADHTGYTHDEMHELLKETFHVKSTAKLNKQEFKELMEKIQRWAAITFELPIPDPDSVDY